MEYIERVHDVNKRWCGVMKQNVCELNKCSACGACENICPQKCITMHKNLDGSLYTEYDTELCVHCGLCEKVCPQLSGVELNYPKYAYAAWAKDRRTHIEGASGGVASVFYQYAIDNHMKIVGCYMDKHFEARFRIGESERDIVEFKNSKYTYSYMDSIYREIASHLKSGENILFIGLPCQVSALKKYVSLSKHKGQLVTVDVVCHGTPPPEYLQKHIEFIENKTGKKAKTVFFRDPAYKTNKYAFTIYSESIFERTNLLSKNPSPTYIKYVGEGDNYQIGYHKSLIYRENCYSCYFAQRNRAGDLTLSDYRGFGKYAPWSFSKHQVSCILVNTEEGRVFLGAVMESGLLTAYKRPLLEPLESDAQLNHSSQKPPEREAFLQEYVANGGDYEAAANKAFKKIKIKSMVLYYTHCREIRIFIVGLIPGTLKRHVKKLLGRG